MDLELNEVNDIGDWCNIAKNENYTVLIVLKGTIPDIKEIRLIHPNRICKELIRCHINVYN